jgi:peroxiredoxin
VYYKGISFNLERHRMITTTSRRTALRDTAGMVLMLSVLWFSTLPTLAGELSEVPAALPPGFSLPDLAGQQRSLDEFAGKVLLVNFWASWCWPCIEELPGIQRLIAAMADAPFAVIGVNVGEAERRVQATVKQLRMDFPILLDKDSAAFKGWGANVLPTAYILDGSGRVRYIGRGPVEWDRADIVEMLRQLAEQPPHGK